MSINVREKLTQGGGLIPVDAIEDHSPNKEGVSQVMFCAIVMHIYLQKLFYNQLRS